MAVQCGLSRGQLIRGKHRRALERRARPNLAGATMTPFCGAARGRATATAEPWAGPHPGRIVSSRGRVAKEGSASGGACRAVSNSKGIR